MTLDDDSSIYVGGLPYDASEQTIRSVFHLYGAILDVKIINEHRTRGKCYCFVTFTNTRSAINAINDMNGRTIDGRVIKVNGVRTRGGRSNFGSRERYHHAAERDVDWDRDRDRGYDHDRDGYRNRNGHWPRERDRSRDPDQDRDRRVEHMHDRHHDDHAGEPSLDKGWSRGDDRAGNGQDNGRAYSEDMDGDHSFDLNTDRRMDTSDRDKIFDEDKNEQSRRNNDLNVNNHHHMHLSSDSNGNHSDQVEDELKQSTEQLDQLKKEVSQMGERLEEKRLLVMDLQKKSRKLEEALTNVKKHTSYRQKQLTNLHKCFVQVKECTERLKTSEKELKAIVDASSMLENDGDGVGFQDGQLANGRY
ncbi:hypothetical protein S245_069529 [Arachis hypogaea]